MFAGCQRARPRGLSFAERVAGAHGVEEWEAEQALQGELLARFETGDVVDLRFVIEVDGPRVRMAVGDGTPEGRPTVVGFDGTGVWVSPEGSGVREARGMVGMWPTLIALPFRMAGRGVRVEEVGERELGAVSYEVAKVTFERPVEGLGEWVLVYVEPETKLVKAVVHAVGEEPRAVSFYGFEDVSGVKLATEWKFWRWSEGAGIYDKPVGTGSVFNLGFTTVGELRASGRRLE
jgi:hypothetical protein